MNTGSMGKQVHKDSVGAHISRLFNCKALFYGLKMRNLFHLANEVVFSDMFHIFVINHSFIYQGSIPSVIRHLLDVIQGLHEMNVTFHEMACIKPSCCPFFRS